MKRFVMGMALALLPITGFSQQRYDERYHSAINDSTRKIIEFFDNCPSNISEHLICYDFGISKGKDLSMTNFQYANIVSQQKMDSVFAASNDFALAHNHNQDAQSTREYFFEKKRLYKKLQKIPDEILEKRVLNEFPSYDDIATYCQIRDRYDTDEKQYIYCESGLYSFYIPKGITAEEAIRSYFDVIRSVQKKYCGFFKMPGRRPERDKEEILSWINLYTPVKIIEYVP